MNNKLKFKHSGKMGDIIWSLAYVEFMGGGTLYLNVNGPHGFTLENYNFMKPLLEKQPYINEVKIWNGEPVDYDLDNFRYVMNKSWKGSAAGSYFNVFGVPLLGIDIETKPWLYVDYVPNDNIIISRSPSLMNRSETNPFWENLIRNNPNRKFLFVGLQNECDTFNAKHNCNIPYHPVQDALELAVLINGSYLWTGNHSMPAVIAEATKRTLFLEVRGDVGRIDHYFDRPNMFII